MPFLPHIDPLFIDYLIIKEEKDKKNDISSEFVQIPLIIPVNVPKKPDIKPKSDENNENSENEGAIVIEI